VAGGGFDTDGRISVILTEVDQAHVLSVIEDSTTPENNFLLDDNNLKL